MFLITSQRWTTPATESLALTEFIRICCILILREFLLLVEVEFLLLVEFWLIIGEVAVPPHMEDRKFLFRNPYLKFKVINCLVLIICL